MADAVVAFQNQLASVMEILVRNAVCEITRLYEDSFVDFQSILAQNDKEIANLKIKLQQSERVLTLQAERETRINCAESCENSALVDTVIKEEDAEIDVKIDIFCAVCGKSAETEPPFCDACRKTMQFPSPPQEGSALSQVDRPGGNSVDFSKDLDLNTFDTGTEEFPTMFDPKLASCFSFKGDSGRSLMVQQSPITPSVSDCGPSSVETHPPAKRTRTSPEVDGMAVEAKELVQAVLARRPEGDRIMEEYRAKGTLTDVTRRHLINMLVAHMTETQGKTPPKNVRELYALGIITLFPSLKDPFSQKGYEHFYDGKSGTGYLAWRLKTVQRNKFHRGGGVQRSTESRGVPRTVERRGPSVERRTHLGEQLQGDRCQEAISYLAQCSDREQIFIKMRETFQFRQQLVHDPQRSGTVLSTFPRLLDTKGLVNQDFTLLFGLETSCKLLENWDNVFKAKVIKEARSITQSTDLSHLLRCAEQDPLDLKGWDSDMASFLLLVHLLPPPPGGRRSAKISAREAVDRVVQFQKVSPSPAWRPSATGGQRQPYLVAVGEHRDQILSFYIGLEHHLLPCQANCSLGAFDELFKAHFVLGLPYDEALSGVYTFLQTTVYNIDVGSVKESPRVKELRARLLNDC